ncbi:hypothetical protein FACS1894189_3870 [Planctomycetales bacterium]|nr:hypothetical protein FACS1894189_3870 [Planctomycetales bacterium]
MDKNICHQRTGKDTQKRPAKCGKSLSGKTGNEKNNDGTQYNHRSKTNTDSTPTEQTKRNNKPPNNKTCKNKRKKRTKTGSTAEEQKKYCKERKEKKRITDSIMILGMECGCLRVGIVQYSDQHGISDGKKFIEVHLRAELINCSEMFPFPFSGEDFNFKNL